MSPDHNLEWYAYSELSGTADSQNHQRPTFQTDHERHSVRHQARDEMHVARQSIGRDECRSNGVNALPV
jgi:hypothetical protein